MDSVKINNLGISFESCCLAGNKRWFFLNECNALCNMDIDGDIINFSGSVPWENGFTKYLFADIRHFNGTLILAPRGASSIALYNIKENKFSQIKLEKIKAKSKNAYVNWLKFICSVIVDDSIYMIPRTYPAIVELNLATRQVDYHNQWLHEADERLFENEAFFWSDYAVNGKTIILAAANGVYLMFFDTVRKSHQIVECKNNENGFSGIERLEDNLLLTGRKDGAIKLWDSNSNTIKNFGQLPQGFFVHKIIGFSKLVRIGSWIMAIPLWANMLLKIDPGRETIVCLKDYDKERNGNEEIAVCCTWIEKGQLYCHNNLLKQIDIFDEKGYCGCVDLKIAEDFCQCMEKDMRSINQPLPENPVFSLTDYQKYVTQADETQIQEENRKSYGAGIYSYLCQHPV